MSFIVLEARKPDDVMESRNGRRTIGQGRATREVNAWIDTC